MARRRMAAVLAATMAALLTAGAGTAFADSTVTEAGNTITFTAAAGDTNLLGIYVEPSGTELRFDDSVNVVDGGGCTISGGDGICPFNATTRILISLDDMNDGLSAGTIPNGLTVDLGAGDDGFGATLLTGSAGADTISGGPGNDTIDGNAGGDTLNGEAGDDSLRGSAGDDTLNGGDGDDNLDGGDGADAYNGGTGIDTAFFGSATGETVTADLDGQADDGRPGEGDRVGTDVEDLSGSSGDDTFTGDGGANILNGNNGEDTLDPGAGEDVVIAWNGNDTVLARDGFADNVDCGTGTDTAIVDSLDRVEGCESVDSADVGSAREDRPPTVSFAGPSENTFLPTASASTITALATDDRGVAEVRLIDDGDVVGTDTTAPYTFSYRPRGDDVGRNTLVLLAVDTSDQTASAVRPLRVMRFAPRALLFKVTPTRDRFAPFRYRTTGHIRMPRGVTKAQGCRKGRVSIQIKRGSKTISSRRVALGKKCGFSSRVTFHTRRRVGFGSLRFVVRFLGNSVLIPRSGLTLKGRTS